MLHDGLCPPCGRGPGQAAVQVSPATSDKDREDAAMKYAIRALGAHAAARAAGLLAAFVLAVLATPAPGGVVSGIAGAAAKLRQIDEATRARAGLVKPATGAGGKAGKVFETQRFGSVVRPSWPPKLQPLVAAWSAAGSHLPRVKVVEIDVKRFEQAFRIGAEDPYGSLAMEIERHPKLRALVERWFATPPDKRVFRTLTKDDVFDAAAERERLEADGYMVFDYLDCQRELLVLCDSTAIGAMAETSGVLVNVLSDSAGASAFLGVENRLLDELWLGGPVLLTVDANELRQALAQARAGAARVQAGTAAGVAPGARIAALMVACVRVPIKMRIGMGPPGPCEKRAGGR